MVPFGDFWSRKVMLRPFVLLSQIDFAQKVKFAFLAKSIWDSKYKGIWTSVQMKSHSDFWTGKVMLRPFVFLSQIDFAKKWNFTFLPKSIWDSKYKGIRRSIEMKKSQNEHMLKSVPWLQPYWCFCGPKMTKWAHVDLRQQKQRYLRGQRGPKVKKGNFWDVICLRKCGGCSRADICCIHCRFW